MLIKRMKTSTPEGRDRSAMGKGGGEGEGIHMHTHTQTKERRGEGHTPHSPFRTRPTTHSLPYSRSESQLLREEKCFKGAAERRDRVCLPDVPGQGIPQNGSNIRESSLTITLCFDNPWPRNSKKRLISYI